MNSDSLSMASSCVRGLYITLHWGDLKHKIFHLTEHCRGQAVEARPVREGEVAASGMGLLSLEFPFTVSGWQSNPALLEMVVSCIPHSNQAQASVCAWRLEEKKTGIPNQARTWASFFFPLLQCGGWLQTLDVASLCFGITNWKLQIRWLLLRMLFPKLSFSQMQEGMIPSKYTSF